MDEKGKDDLAKSLGWTRAKFNEELESLKTYFTDKEREARKVGKTTIKQVGKEDL